MKGDEIPNGEYLFRYANPDIIPVGQKEIPSSIFEGQEELSCDWEKYQKHPHKSFHMHEGRSMILKIHVCEEIKMPCNPTQPRQKQPSWEQKVLHDPIAKGEDKFHPDIENNSHSLIKGKKRLHICNALRNNTEIYLPPIEEERPEKIEEDSKNVIYIPIILLLSILSIILIMLYRTK